jgi:hypothetical protein
LSIVNDDQMTNCRSCIILSTLKTDFYCVITTLTPLEIACCYGNLELITLLIQNNIYEINKYFYYAFNYAVCFNHLSTIYLLIENFNDLSIDKILEAKFIFRDFDMFCKLLQEYKFTEEQLQISFINALYLNIRICDLLIEYGFDPYSVSPTEDTISLNLANFNYILNLYPNLDIKKIFLRSCRFCYADTTDYILSNWDIDSETMLNGFTISMEQRANLSTFMQIFIDHNLINIVDSIAVFKILVTECGVVLTSKMLEYIDPTEITINITEILELCIRNYKYAIMKLLLKNIYKFEADIPYILQLFTHENETYKQNDENILYTEILEILNQINY